MTWAAIPARSSTGPGQVGEGEALVQEIRRLPNVEVRLATETEFSPHFPDCEVGAEPPFGALYGVPMLVDDTLRSEEITFNAGTNTETLTMALSDYLELTKPLRVDLAAT